ncbi:hypothetical protein Sa4125_29840 [Aureimonas sp. SA4125]|uniref:hypothetical protein n=1 Tax=Aureimonas sp. SA4125 TaxID=2826993 RepID=UPI001CC7EDF3|nr:hypothetical protein [Aureimonas sp. SA4125]BDA85442.1 hypothetical protein Sa4125_29840 [Aureimonas sp. SA4125]
MILPVADMHGRPFEITPGVPRGTHEWRVDYAGAVDQWFCRRCGENWWELSEDKPLTPCRKAAT